MKTAWITLATALFGASLAQAQDLPDPGQTYIESFGYNGAGCHAGTVSQNLSADRQALTLIFSEFGVSGGIKVGMPNRQIECLLSMAVHVPVGYSFSILQIDTRGYANIAPQSVGFTRTMFRWGNSPVGLTKLSETSLPGTYQNDFIASTAIRSESLAWSPCAGSSQPLTINNIIGINGQQGTINVDSIDTSFVTKYKLQWRRCQDPGQGFPIARLGTQGSVARDTSLCINFRQGTMTVSTAAPAQGQPFARLKHYATAVTGAAREFDKDSANANRMDIYKLPGDWNSITDLQPEVNATPVVQGRNPGVSVDQPSGDTKCVRIAGAPANLAIKWNPKQP